MHRVLSAHQRTSGTPAGPAATADRVHVGQQPGEGMAMLRPYGDLCMMSAVVGWYIAFVL